MVAKRLATRVSYDNLVQVPHLAESKPTSEASMETVWIAVEKLFAMISSNVPLNPLSRTQ